ncbi:phytanoyl-CoA dioxygenase family protein [Corallincola luteus]|nr:phytanoyl-CoA dioxygenase family protein [Corallincola luteus]
MPLGNEAYNFIREQGYLHIPRYMDSDTTLEIYEAIREVVFQESLRAYNTPEFYKLHQAINFTFDNPHLNNEILRKFSESLSKVSNQIIGPSDFHMTLIQHNKSGLNHSIPWHQDIDSSAEPGNFYNFLFYPHDSNESIGGLRVVPKSHTAGPLSQGGSHDYLEGEITIFPKAGDLIIVDGLTFHAVSPNLSEQDRVSFCTRYISKELIGTKALDIGRYRTGSYDYAEKKDLDFA